MRVVFVIGSFPPCACGAEEYTVLLSEALRQIGVEANIVAAGKWKAFDVGRLIQEISELYPDVVHIQYPTMGYRYPTTGYRKSLLPQALTTLMPKVPVLTTVHEFSQTHFLRRASNLPFSLFGRTLIFTSEYERRRFLSWFPWAAKRSLVIPIGNNIPFFLGSVERDPLKVVHFGLIRPKKGLEDFLQLAKLAKDAGRPYRFTVVGEPVPRFRSYLENMREGSSELPVEWKMGLSANEVSQFLAHSRFAYAPLPDGASKRRGSLLAALGNGAVVITTKGSQTPRELDEIVRFAVDPSQALELLDELTADTSQADTLSSKAREYAAHFSWPNISGAHLRVYEQILRNESVELDR